MTALIKLRNNVAQKVSSALLNAIELNIKKLFDILGIDNIS